MPKSPFKITITLRTNPKDWIWFPRTRQLVYIANQISNIPDIHKVTPQVIGYNESLMFTVCSWHSTNFEWAKTDPAFVKATWPLTPYRKWHFENKERNIFLTIVSDAPFLDRPDTKKRQLVKLDRAYFERLLS